ncbi:TetR/AcrR family transcriptional regulator [Curtobacterium pusillum]|uniref:TetR/AcrR family transcriptional regulator n=1 Tax=Curtobacterium pusillum TaxID=69373 RepID=UPI001C30BEB6|nr:TetR/AcrR family transcriptional regulator [Curtobacterium pusillum]
MLTVSTSADRYHHGDLRAALLAAAVETLEAGETFSLRAVARRAGVSATAPYRHFPDRRALDSAVAVAGFQDLRSDLVDALGALPGSSAPVEVIATLGTAYVEFALRRPAVFRLMFGNECDDADSERVQAAEELHDLLHRVLERLFPGTAVSDLSTALWSTAHGLAFLHLDGKLRPEPLSEVTDRVRASVVAIFGLGAAAAASPAHE